MPIRRPARLAGAAALVAAAVALGGCGLGAGPGTKNAALQVTESFGTVPVGAVTQKTVPGQETVMQLLQRHFTVATGYGGGFVNAIDGRGRSDHEDWFYYVNGIEAAKGAAATDVNDGDRIWWDLHNWTATDSIPAVVGSYPQPFLNGLGGKQYPTLLTCANVASSACTRVARSLRDAGVKVSFQAFGTGSGSDSLSVIVGTFAQIRGIIAAELLGAGPATSGVYAQNVGTSVIELDDPAGEVVRTLRAGSGLVAATEQPSLNMPAWIVTGTDTAGVDAAARAFTVATLHNRFAVAVSGTEVIPVPIVSAR